MFRSMLTLLFALPLAVPISVFGHPGHVIGHQKISDTHGNFSAVIEKNGTGLGVAVSSLGDLDGDGVSEIVLGGNPGSRGAIWVLHLDDSGNVKQEFEISHRSETFPGNLVHGDGFGNSISAIGDLDDDGVVDLAIGAPGDDLGSDDLDLNHGSVWILFLNHDGSAKSARKISDGYGGVPFDLDQDLFGYSVAALGDFDGDQVEDLMVGALTGRLWMLLLNTDGTVREATEIGLPAGLMSGIAQSSNESFGVAVTSLGDLDQDGVVDVAISGRDSVASGSLATSVWILFLNSDATIKASRKISNADGGFTGGYENGDFFGSSLASAGDIDGDGVPDLLVGMDQRPISQTALRDEHSGAAWLLFLERSGAVKDHVKIGAGADGFSSASVGGEWRGERFGSSIVTVGDVNGDGVHDIAVGAVGDEDGGSGDNFGTGHYDRGALWVLFLDGCGNGIVDATEECDDPSAVGGCCDTTCTFSASGTLCHADPNLCTIDTCDGQGNCTNSSSCTTTTSTTTTSLAQPRCSQPISTGDYPTASDCLYILRASVGSATCTPECICTPSGSNPVSATDALICLRAAVGMDVSDLNCTC